MLVSLSALLFEDYSRCCVLLAATLFNQGGQRGIADGDREGVAKILHPDKTGKHANSVIGWPIYTDA